MITAARRLQKENQDQQKNLKTSPMTSDRSGEIQKLEPNPENIMHWTATISAPSDCFYEGYAFELDINVPSNYPLVPPIIKFKTKIFHPNVLFDNGEICLDILKKEWSPAWSLNSACRAIIALLSDPADDSPLNVDAGNMLREKDFRAYRSMVKMYCIEHAIPLQQK
jgi:peroxin-4